MMDDRQMATVLCCENADRQPQGTVSRYDELQFLRSFIRESCFDEEICRRQLRALWTAYCLHHGLDVDTSEYDLDLLKLWNDFEKTDSAAAGVTDWPDLDGFDMYMCKDLV